MVQNGEHEKGVRGRFFFRGLHGSRQNYLRTYSSTLETKYSNPEVSLYWAFTQNFLGFQVMIQIPSNYSIMREVCVIWVPSFANADSRRGFIEMCREKDSRSRHSVSRPLFAQHLKNRDLCSECLWRESQWWLLKDCRVLPHQRRSIWSENWKQKPLKELTMEVPNKCW